MNSFTALLMTGGAACAVTTAGIVAVMLFDEAAHLLPVTLKKQSAVTMVCLGIGVLLALLVLQAKH